ncbi:MAG: hypothetical protein ACI8V2_004128 [Candidatus Latescibacterota bacterium]|jgi:hypothetical protein
MGLAVDNEKGGFVQRVIGKLVFMRIFYGMILCFGFLVSHIDAQEMSVLEGMILGKAAPLGGANIAVIMEKDTLSTVTDDVGAYRIDRIRPGAHRLEASHVAYQKSVENAFVFVGGQTHQWNVTLLSRELTLDEIVVNPGSFSVMDDDPVTPRGLSRAEIKAIPAVTDDIFRTVERLPGVSGGDFLARFTVRGGDYDQVLVTLDGLELFEPFHLKDLGGGVLSIIDAEVVGGLDMMTGGFSADFGNRQSAVLQMRSRRPEEGMRASFSAGIMNARLLADGANDKWGFLVSGRRGYADIMVAKIDPERDFNPEYYDIFGKVTYNGGNHQLGAQVLWASDNGGFTQVDGDHLESAYGNGYTWLTWDAILGSHFVVRTLPYYGRITSDREATLINAEDGADELVDDIRTTTLYGLKSDAKWQWHENHITRFGGELRWLKSDYDYRRQESRLTDLVGAGRFGVTYDDVVVDVTPEGQQNSFYLSHKWRLHKQLTADVGGRFDRQTNTNDEVWSPRAGLALALDEVTMLRTAWGRYYQAQHIGALDVHNGVQTFQPSARATHYVMGIERLIGTDILARIEGYHKAYDKVWSRYENLNQNHTSDPLPDVVDGWAQVYPVTGTARGIEFYVKRDTGLGLNWWATYALTSTRETFASGVGDPKFQGETFPRAFDQAHSISFDLIYRPVSDWFVGAAWQFRSGWPHTPLVLEDRPDGSQRFVFGDFYSELYPVYHRLDVKVTHWAEYDSWKLVFGLGMSNIYGRTNIRHYSYFLQNGQARRLIEGWLPALPFASVSAEF